MKTDEILDDREKTHGSFSKTAQISNELKNVIKQHYTEKLTTVKIEALEAISGKIARILSGDPNFKDHWDDIAGYAKLGAEEIKYVVFCDAIAGCAVAGYWGRGDTNDN